MDATFGEILRSLKVLRAAKPADDLLFGLGGEFHKFKLHPRVSERALHRFESKHHIELPSDYKLFLMHVGNGGAGPYYGVFELGEMDDCHDFRNWKEGDGFVGVLSKPFPHSSEWNDLTGRPEYTGQENPDQEKEYHAALETFEDRYWSSDHVNGAVPICHEGCALRDWLVVTGPEAGHIWHDARADEAGLSPVAVREKKRVTFLEWYLAWLNDAIQKLSKACR